MPRFAANLSMLFTELPMLERFEAARVSGFGAVELQFPYAWPAGELARAARDARLPIVLFNLPAGSLLDGGDGLACVPGEEPEFAEAVELGLAYVALLAPRCVNVLPGRLPVGAPRADALATFRANLSRAASRLVAAGVQPVVEALNRHDQPRFLLSSHDELVDFLDESASEVKVQYDIYHQVRMGRDPAVDLRHDAARIAHVQFADVPGRGEPGSGTLPFAALFALLDEVHEGHVGAEYAPRGPTASTLGFLAMGR